VPPKWAKLNCRWWAKPECQNQGIPGSSYHPSRGAPNISTRLVVALHYLKFQHDLSDEDVIALWVENPYWQHFSGMKNFQHGMPIDPSSMTS
jgi:IS5 family transposase